MMLTKKQIKFAAIGAGVSFFGILFGYVIFPIILKSQIKKESALSKTTDLREMWETIPFPFSYKIYIFNYTNPEEIHNGGTPIVKEIGPYHFDEWKEKIDLEDNDGDDTVSFRRRNTFYFRPDLSGRGLNGEEMVIIPHVFLLTIITSVYRATPLVLGAAGKAINIIFDNPQDVFLRVKVLDILFRGIIINCNRTEFTAKSACKSIRKEAGDIMIFEPNNQYRFSLFGKNNATIGSQIIKVKRGMKNVKDVGRIVSVDGATEQSIWKDSCNQYGGGDPTVFPPMLSKKDRIESYYTEFCRPFKPWFESKSKYHGIKTHRYVVDVGDLGNDPELQCYCNEKCTPKGIMNLTKCFKAPLFISMPHFLNADEAVSSKIKGLRPDRNRHMTIVDFEPISGTPMSAKLRMQFNIELLKIDKLKLTKNLTDVIAPIWWVEENSELNKTFVKMMKKQLFIPKMAVTVTSWCMIVFGLIGSALPILLPHKEKIIEILTFHSN